MCARTHSDLLAEGAVAVVLEAVQLVGLPQQGVEGLAGAVHCGGVGGDGEGRHQAHLLQRGGAVGRSVQQLRVLQVLRQPLQHGQRLVEVYLDGNKRTEWKRQLVAKHKEHTFPFIVVDHLVTVAVF